MVRARMTSRRQKSLADLPLPPRDKRPESLTIREQQILECIWSGLSNKQIAQQLHISDKTVEAHRGNMMKKLRVSNAAQLLKTAIAGGLIRVRGAARSPAPPSRPPLTP